VEPERRGTKSGHVSCSPTRLFETAHAVMNKTHVQSSQETGCDEAIDVIECTHAIKALLF
jgi:hypothetical protein